MLTTSVIIFRLLISAILAFIIWLEREYKFQPAGIRTHILIGIWSCLFMIISIMLPEMYNATVSDPGRIAAQVVSWVWFLGAWAIIKIGLNTKGLTTAANIWATAAIGLAVWAGIWVAALAATACILFNLVGISYIKGRFMKKSRYCSIHLDFNKSKLNEDKITQTIQQLPIIIVTKNIKEDSKKSFIRIIAKTKKNVDIYHIHKELKHLDGLLKIAIWENVKWG
jgi:putative Mg2+ transporter-C (MgtC) family protein